MLWPMTLAHCSRSSRSTSAARRHVGKTLGTSKLKETVLALPRARRGGDDLGALDAVTCDPDSLSTAQIQEAGRLLLRNTRKPPSEACECWVHADHAPLQS